MRDWTEEAAGQCRAGPALCRRKCPGLREPSTRAKLQVTAHGYVRLELWASAAPLHRGVIDKGKSCVPRAHSVVAWYTHVP